MPDPCSGKLGARLYRTGDLDRIIPDGELEYHGRIDRQVKVNGIRVELAEVERVLCTEPDVEDCAATLERDSDTSVLAAMVVLRPGATVEELSAALRNDHPSSLVPAALLPVTALSRLPNGKVDGRAVSDTLARIRRAGTAQATANRTLT